MPSRLLCRGHHRRSTVLLVGVRAKAAALIAYNVLHTTNCSAKSPVAHSLQGADTGAQAARVPRHGAAVLRRPRLGALRRGGRLAAPGPPLTHCSLFDLPDPAIRHLSAAAVRCCRLPWTVQDIGRDLRVHMLERDAQLRTFMEPASRQRGRRPSLVATLSWYTRLPIVPGPQHLSRGCARWWWTCRGRRRRWPPSTSSPCRSRWSASCTSGASGARHYAGSRLPCPWDPDP